MILSNFQQSKKLSFMHHWPLHFKCFVNSGFFNQKLITSIIKQRKTPRIENFQLSKFFCQIRTRRNKSRIFESVMSVLQNPSCSEFEEAIYVLFFWVHKRQIVNILQLLSTGKKINLFKTILWEMTWLVSCKCFVKTRTLLGAYVLFYDKPV